MTIWEKYSQTCRSTTLVGTNLPMILNITRYLGLVIQNQYPEIRVNGQCKCYANGNCVFNTVRIMCQVCRIKMKQPQEIQTKKQTVFSMTNREKNSVCNNNPTTSQRLIFIISKGNKQYGNIRGSNEDIPKGRT